MKRILISLIFLSAIHTVFSQENEGNKIALSVVMPDNGEGLSASQLSKLKTKVISIVTANGLAATGIHNNFVIYPIFSVYDKNAVEGGMENIYVTTCELSLYIQHTEDNIVFASYGKKFKGSGESIETAITNSISKIPQNSKEITEFIETGKQKIIVYYEGKCEDFKKQAESLTKMQKYEEAIALLQSIPEEISCYQQMVEKSVEVYKAYQNKVCGELLQKAKAQISIKNYKGAMEFLGQIDPSSSCSGESRRLMQSISNHLDAVAKQRWEHKMKVYNDNLELKKQRIDAAKQIAIAYYKSRPKVVSYNYLVQNKTLILNRY